MARPSARDPKSRKAPPEAAAPSAAARRGARSTWRGAEGRGRGCGRGSDLLGVIHEKRKNPNGKPQEAQDTYYSTPLHVSFKERMRRREIPSVSCQRRLRVASLGETQLEGNSTQRRPGLFCRQRQPWQVLWMGPRVSRRLREAPGACAAQGGGPEGEAAVLNPREEPLVERLPNHSRSHLEKLTNRGLCIEMAFSLSANMRRSPPATKAQNLSSTSPIDHVGGPIKGSQLIMGRKPKQCS